MRTCVSALACAANRDPHHSGQPPWAHCLASISVGGSMPAKTPEEICSLFQKYMAEGDIESLLDLYDPEAVFLNESGQLRNKQELRQELTPPARAKSDFHFEIQQVIRSG